MPVTVDTSFAKSGNRQAADKAAEIHPLRNVRLTFLHTHFLAFFYYRASQSPIEQVVMYIVCTLVKYFYTPCIHVYIKCTRKCVYTHVYIKFIHVFGMSIFCTLLYMKWILCIISFEI